MESRCYQLFTIERLRLNLSSWFHKLLTYRKIKATIEKVLIMTVTCNFTLHLLWRPLPCTKTLCIFFSKIATSSDISAIYFSTLQFVSKASLSSYSIHGLTLNGWAKCPDKEELETFSQEQIERSCPWTTTSFSSHSGGCGTGLKSVYSSRPTNILVVRHWEWKSRSVQWE